MKLGQLYKKAQAFELIQKEACTIINLSRVSKRELYKKARMSESNFYARLQKQNFTAEQIVKLFTTLVEITNLEIAKK